MFSVADQLIPLFANAFIDVGLARRMAVSAIQAYQPVTRADYVNVARTIAFSMSALALLGSAAAQDMTMPEKMRAYGRANALSRSADQSERTMMQRRSYQQANPRAEQPPGKAWVPEPPASAPVPDNVPILNNATALDDATVAALVNEAMSSVRAEWHLAGPKADAVQTPPPVESPTATQRPAPSASLVTPPAATPATAIHYNGPRPDAGEARTVSYKEELLRQGAAQRTVEPSGVPLPVSRQASFG
jgi:hypothetical protein